MAVECAVCDDFQDGCLTRSQDILLALGLDAIPASDDTSSDASPKREPRTSFKVAAHPPDAFVPSERLRDRKSIKKPGLQLMEDPTPKSTTGPNGASSLSKHGLGAFGARKLYLCRWCGLPKKNHVCEGAVEPIILANRQRAARSAFAAQRDASSSASSSSSSSSSTITAEEDSGIESYQHESDPEAEAAEGGRGKTRARRVSATESATLGPDANCSSLLAMDCPSGIMAIGKRVEGVFLTDSGILQWYGGVIAEFSQSSGEHLVIYDDGEQKWHDLDEGIKTETLRWPSGGEVWSGDGAVAPIVPAPEERAEASPRKRRLPEPEPDLAVIEAPPALVCDYCSSRGKVHRKCLRLDSCAIIWKRGGKSKARNNGDPGTPTTPPTPGVEHVRSGRAPALPLAKRNAQVLSARASEPSLLRVESEDFEFVPTPRSDEWPFPVIVPPEALGFTIENGVVKYDAPSFAAPAAVC